MIVLVVVVVVVVVVVNNVTVIANEYWIKKLNIFIINIWKKYLVTHQWTDKPDSSLATKGYKYYRPNVEKYEYDLDEGIDMFTSDFYVINYALEQISIKNPLYNKYLYRTVNCKLETIRNVKTEERYIYE